MTTPRCTMPGCPVRYRGGPDRPCVMHRADETDLLNTRAAAMGALMQPGDGGQATDGQATDGHRATGTGQAVNRHGVPVR
jgi:hypothetical protein